MRTLNTIVFIAFGLAVQGAPLRAVEVVVTEVHDIHPTGSSTPLEFTEFNTELYFRACGVNGCELFKTDGNVLTEFDINPAGDSDSASLTVYNDQLFFRATGVHGRELFKTDGTEIKEFDINPDGDSLPDLFTEYDGQLYFTACTTRLRTVSHGWKFSAAIRLESQSRVHSGQLDRRQRPAAVRCHRTERRGAVRVPRR